MNSNEFDTIWEADIKKLEGREIFTRTGKRNIISKVGDDFIERISSNGVRSSIKRQIFKEVYSILKEQKVLTRAEIHKRYKRERASSIICAIMGNVRNITFAKKSIITLEMH